jgi:hypothetical protein
MYTHIYNRGFIVYFIAWICFSKYVARLIANIDAILEQLAYALAM